VDFIPKLCLKRFIGVCFQKNWRVKGVDVKFQKNEVNIKIWFMKVSQTMVKSSR
jgi:hypothetical protein